MRRAFQKLDNRNCGFLIAEDFEVVFRRAFNVPITPEEASDLVSLFCMADNDPSGTRVNFSQFCYVVEKEMSRGHKPRRAR